MKDNIKNIINTFDELVLNASVQDIKDALFILETKYKVRARK
jgi:hypothetical protein